MHVLLNSIEKVKEFVKVANTFESDISLKIGRYTIDGKSIMGVFSLNLSEPLELEVIEQIDGDTERLCKKLAEIGINVTEE